MSQITQGTLARIDKWLAQGISIETMFPNLEQRYRMQLCAEYYKRWVQNKDIDPRTTCRNIARRDYELFINQAAQGNKEAVAMIQALGITVDDEGNVKIAPSRSSTTTWRCAIISSASSLPTRVRATRPCTSIRQNG